MNFIWQSVSMVFIFSSTRGNGKDVCGSALKLQAISSYEFRWTEKELSNAERCIQNYNTSWILQVNDTEAGISPTYSVKCQQDCQHCNDESLRPHPPQGIAYRSTTGSNLCFRWKESVSTNYTMYYSQEGGRCNGNYKRCTADRSENEVECCPQNLRPTATIYVRIDYENQYMYVYGILYRLRANTIVIPNPLKNFTHQLLDATTVEFKFEDPEDWNFDSFSLLDKRICQISPPVEEGTECNIVEFSYEPNSWTKSNLRYDTQYIYTAQCFYIEGRWSEEKSITFRTGGDMSVDANSSTSPGPHDPVITEMRNTSTTATMFASTQDQPVQNQSDPQARPDQNKSSKVPLYATCLLILAGFVIAAMMVILFRACRWASKRLFWEIPEPNIPPIVKYHCVDFRTRNEKLSVSWNTGVDSGRGTSAGTQDESS